MSDMTLTAGRTRTTGTAEAFRIVFAGMCALAVSNGIGRFAFTPLLPFMQAATGFDAATAGLLASLNYAGYLAGVLLAGFLPPGRTSDLWMRGSIVLCVGTVLGMALTEAILPWGVLRFLAGLTGGLAFVLAANIAARRLIEAGRAERSSLLFAGVSMGIAISGALVLPLDALGGWRAGWLGLGVVSVLLAVPSIAWLRDTAPRPAAGPATAAADPPGAGASVAILWTAYLMFGLGYVVSGTFLVAILQGQTGGAVGPLAWCVVGLAGTPAPFLATWATRRYGLLPTLVFGYFALAVGVVLPVFSTTLPAALAAGVLFGATLVGITAQTISLGRRLTPASGARTTAILTSAFGLGQILAPPGAGWLAERTGSFDLPLSIAAGLVAAGALLLVAARRRFR